MLSSGWGPTPYPCCVGHEIVGKAVRVGKNVKHVKVGDRVGVGAQSDSCGKCADCQNGREPNCVNAVNTYGGIYNAPKEGKSMGGYATYNRTPSHFVVKIPESLDSAVAAPSKCTRKYPVLSQQMTDMRIQCFAVASPSTPP